GGWLQFKPRLIRQHLQHARVGISPALDDIRFDMGKRSETGLHVIDRSSHIPDYIARTRHTGPGAQFADEIDIAARNENQQHVPARFQRSVKRAAIFVRSSKESAVKISGENKAVIPALRGTPAPDRGTACNFMMDHEAARWVSRVFSRRRTKADCTACAA